MTPEQEERLVAAFESMAESMDYIAGTLQAHHVATFPTKKEPVDATVTHVKTEEEKLREEQGASDEPLEKWTSLGPREAQYLRDHPEEREAGQSAAEGRTPRRRKPDFGSIPD